ncbi:MAG: MEDS domain-containing protein [Acidobacteria bacterium]|nr:MEDS domain-containing protein [Acidobacteriota bacterium]
MELGIADWRVPLHSHIACLCETGEQLAEALGFVTVGLRGSDGCVLLGAAADLRLMLGVLERQGIDLAGLQGAGRLQLLKRRASAQAMLDDAAAAMAAALQAGASVVRCSGIVGWERHLEAPDAELFTFEAALTEFAQRWPCVILCLHLVEAMGGPTLHHGALATHPAVYVAGGVRANPHFVPLNRTPERLAGIGAKLAARQGERQAAQRRSELLQSIFDNIPVMISLYDPATRRQLFANREWERVTGWSLEEAQGIDILAELYPDPLEHGRAMEVIRRGARQWTAFKTRVRSGAVIDTLWMRLPLSDGTTIGFGQDVTERMRTEERLRQSSEQLRALSAQLRVAREEESARIAREVHDEVGQMLTALRLDVAWLERQVGPLPPPVRGALGGKLLDMSQLLDLAADAVHRIVSELRPGILDELGLEAAVEWYVGEFEKRTEICCRLVSAMAGVKLSPDHATALFRILQEALTNIARHAGATTVDIRLATAASRVTLEVVDDGRGIPEDKIGDSRSIGLLGMRERARALGGDLAVYPDLPHGTTVQVVLPL